MNENFIDKGAEELSKAIDKDMINSIYQNSINEIAGKHLGSKQGDYSAYAGITSVDPSLLVGVPRELNRKDMKVSKFYGVDIWRGYEVSALLDNGFPINFVAVIAYQADSPNIIESKSMKLYWNSFNMMRCGNTVSAAINFITKTATKDLSDVVGSVVKVDLFPAHAQAATTLRPDLGVLKETKSVEEKYESVLSDLSVITSYSDDPSVLVGVEVHPDTVFEFKSTSLRSNCRITNQPDFGDINIRLVPYENKSIVPTEISLLRYIISMRKENHFHEEICERVFSVLTETFNPRMLSVECLYTRRGGWDINPFRYSTGTRLIPAMHNFTTQKTIRQ